MKVSTRLSLAEYFFLYSGFVVLTLLQVWSLVRVTGPLSQALRLSRLKKANPEDQVCGQDLILLSYDILCYPLCGTSLENPVLFPLRNSVVNWSVKPLNLLFCFRSVCYGCMNPTTYVWVTCRDPRTCGLIGSCGMPDSLLF